jgi:hypothetical protein
MLVFNTVYLTVAAAAAYSDEDVDEDDAAAKENRVTNLGPEMRRANRDAPFATFRAILCEQGQLGHVQTSHAGWPSPTRCLLARL